MAQRGFTYGNEDRAEPNVTLTVCTQSGDEAAGLLDEARGMGLASAPARLLELCAEDAGSLDDILGIECAEPTPKEVAALHRLDEAAAKSATPTIVVTTPAGLETVFACMDRSRPQILVGATRAQRAVALAMAVSHIAGSSVRETGGDDRSALEALARQVEQLAKQMEALRTSARPGGFEIVDQDATPSRTVRPPLPDPRLVRSIIKRRQLRARYFQADLFSDPAWDMLLDLTMARAEHRRVSVTSLCLASGVPTTTALRWIAQMVDVGLFERVKDDQDKRRVFIALSDKGSETMASYFAALKANGLPA